MGGVRRAKPHPELRIYPRIMISYVLPTRNRPEALSATLDALGSLADHRLVGGAEVVVVDNASDVRVEITPHLPNGLPVRLVRRETNEGAASRNAGVSAADPRSDWIVMLDDDSHPIDAGHLQRMARAPEDVGAISADIFLPHTGRRESGGLPEVFIGCGVAIRRRVFESLGGYDPAFGYYVEEYDLAARLIKAGYRVEFDCWFRVRHAKTPQGRDMNLIVSRLVRNNGWVAQRYAPETARREELREIRRRYRMIGAKESATAGYAAGLKELRTTISRQRRQAMSIEQWERFTGLSHCRAALDSAMREREFRSAAVIEEGKNAAVVRRVLREMNVRVVGERDGPEALVIGTMSPGPMLDALERREAGVSRTRVIAPWLAAAGGLSRRYGDALAPVLR